jgi:hypothetical protein
MKIRPWLLLSLLASAISWLYAHRIVEPWINDFHAKTHDMIVQMGDLYSPWVGTHELLFHRRNPYGPEVTHEIQMVFYGHAINQTYERPGAPLVNEQRFAYPIYVVFLMAPTTLVDFAEVQRWAPFVLALSITLSVVLCVQILHWRLPWQTVTALVLFTLSSPQIVQGLRLEQLAVVVGFLLTASAWCVSRNHLAIAGALLAFSTIKPQMSLLPLCWFAVWVLGDLPNRWRLAAGLIMTLAAVTAAGELLLPGWPHYFLVGLAAYRKYFPTTSLLRLALGDTLGEILACLIVLGLLSFAWRNRKERGDSRSFLSVLAAFLMGAILAFPLFAPFNQVLLILPAILVLHDWKALPRFSRFVFITMVSWPWIISSVLLLFSARLKYPNQYLLVPSFLVSFFPLLLPLVLMTRRANLGGPQLPAGDLPL